MSKEMWAMKQYLFQQYGQRCEVCGKEFEQNQLTGHHIIMRSKGGEISEDNILIVCCNCHFNKINRMDYNSKEYWKLMNECIRHRKICRG